MIIKPEKEMKKVRLLPVLFCMLFASCSLIDFSEDCIYDGNIDIRFNWNYLLEGDRKPEVMDTWIYTSHVKYCSLYGDTVLTKIQEGLHKVLTLNGTQEMELTGMEDMNTAVVMLPVILKDNKTYIGQAPLLYADRKEVLVQAGKTSPCEFIPRSCVQQVIIDFVIPDNGIALKVERITGELSGVQTGYSFKDMRAVPSEAFLTYNARKTKTGIFRSSNFVFGMNPQKGSGYHAENLLQVGLWLSDDSYHDTTIDLTWQFDGFLSPIIHITLEVRLGLMGMETVITSWETGDGGNIEI